MYKIESLRYTKRIITFSIAVTSMKVPILRAQYISTVLPRYKGISTYWKSDVGGSLKAYGATINIVNLVVFLFFLDVMVFRCYLSAD